MKLLVIKGNIPRTGNASVILIAAKNLGRIALLPGILFYTRDDDWPVHRLP